MSTPTIVTDECIGDIAVSTAMVVEAFVPNACLYDFGTGYKRRHSAVLKFRNLKLELKPNPNIEKSDGMIFASSIFLPSAVEYAK
jgi:hypothetical protein